MHNEKTVGHLTRLHFFMRFYFERLLIVPRKRIVPDFLSLIVKTKGSSAINSFVSFIGIAALPHLISITVAAAAFVPLSSTSTFAL